MEGEGGVNPFPLPPAPPDMGRQDARWLDFNNGSLVLAFGQGKFANGHRCATATNADGRDPGNWRVHGSVHGID